MEGVERENVIVIERVIVIVIVMMMVIEKVTVWHLGIGYWRHWD